MGLKECPSPVDRFLLLFLVDLGRAGEEGAALLPFPRHLRFSAFRLLAAVATGSALQLQGLAGGGTPKQGIVAVFNLYITLPEGLIG